MASRQSAMPPRSLTLTEELERLEQSITLTLQEIDSNFSRAHCIVTASILPVVERYAKHSEAVWEGSKFWKQFFEASANISLTSYEEPEDDTVVDESHAAADDEGQKVHVDDSLSTTGDRPTSHFQNELEGSSLLDSPSVIVKGEKTPRQRPAEESRRGKARETPEQADEETTFAEYPSPYETLKREMLQQKAQTPARQKATSATTPAQARAPQPQPSTARQQNPDPLLHRVLDKTYRVQATPHTAQKRAPGAAHQPHRRQPNPFLDSSPFSSPPAAPQLRADIFGSPARAPRTPGVSVQAGTGKAPRGDIASARKTLFASDGREAARHDAQPWDSDEEDTADVMGGMSPPKTMHFHIPQGRLLQTPAQEASRRIVEDLLATAGMESVTDELEGVDIDDGQGLEWDDGEDSPSVVRVARKDEDDGF